MTQPRLLGDRYELEGVVGRGGMAEVYRARDIRLDRIVAIKTLRADLARDQTFQARFHRESQSAASLNHPSIVAVYDTGEDMATGVPVPYIVMEFVDGQTVRDLLIEGYRLTPERTLEIINGTLRALEYSHQAGIVHRDIKPGNVMVNRNGDVKVMDFGIARAMNDSQATMTQTAQVIGTAQYLSPEQARGERVDARSDLYSTGCLMYELLTGKPPFTGDSPVAIAYQHVRENPVPPSQVNPELPPWADPIVLKAMAKSPDDRYQSAAEMSADIQRAASGMQVAAMAPPATRLDYYGGGYPEATAQMAPPMGGQTSTMQRYPPQGGGYDDYGGGGYGDERGGGNRWVPWLIGALVVVAAVVVAVMLLNSGGSKNSAFIPQVAGQTQAQADQAIKAAGLVPSDQGKNSDSVPKNDVISTSPSEGSSIPKGSTVVVYVSEGAAKVTVPTIQKGETLQSAESAIQAAGLQAVVQQDSTSTAPANTVDHTNPPGNTQVAPNSSVTLFVSAGSAQVPSVIGDTQDQATQALASAGFQVTVVPQDAPNSQPVAQGQVWNQNPGGNVTEPTGTKVQIFVQQTAPVNPNPSPNTTTPPATGGASTTTPPPSGGASTTTAPPTGGATTSAPPPGGGA
jgi:serine/threonine-protein kinase